MIRATGEETKQEGETLPKAKETTETQATQDSVGIATKFHTTGRPLAPKHQHQKKQNKKTAGPSHHTQEKGPHQEKREVQAR